MLGMKLSRFQLFRTVFHVFHIRRIIPLNRHGISSCPEGLFLHSDYPLIRAHDHDFLRRCHCRNAEGCICVINKKLRIFRSACVRLTIQCNHIRHRSDIELQCIVIRYEILIKISQCSLLSPSQRRNDLRAVLRRIDSRCREICIIKNRLRLFNSPAPQS